MLRDHSCCDAEPCDLPEIERTLETGWLMASEGQELVPDASDPWSMTTGDIDLSDQTLMHRD